MCPDNLYKLTVLYKGLTSVVYILVNGGLSDALEAAKLKIPEGSTVIALEMVTLL